MPTLMGRIVICDLLDGATEGTVRASGTYALGQATTMCIGECIASRQVLTRGPPGKYGGTIDSEKCRAVPMSGGIWC